MSSIYIIYPIPGQNKILQRNRKQCTKYCLI